MPHREYRRLEKQCHNQAVLTAHERTRQELQKMELEYKAVADWLEQQANPRPHAADEAIPPSS